MEPFFLFLHTGQPSHKRSGKEIPWVFLLQQYLCLFWDTVSPPPAIASQSSPNLCHRNLRVISSFSITHPVRAGKEEQPQPQGQDCRAQGLFGLPLPGWVIIRFKTNRNQSRLPGPGRKRGPRSRHPSRVKSQDRAQAGRSVVRPQAHAPGSAPSAPKAFLAPRSDSPAIEELLTAKKEGKRRLSSLLYNPYHCPEKYNPHPINTNMSTRSNPAPPPAWAQLKPSSNFPAMLYLVLTVQLLPFKHYI